MRLRAGSRCTFRVQQAWTRIAMPESLTFPSHCVRGRSVSKDISKTQDGLDFDPEQISVLIVKGDDGSDKIQLRLDLGLLQMEFDGRPDGRRIHGCASWLDYLQKQQRTHDERHPDGPPFYLETDDCQQLLREG